MQFTIVRRSFFILSLLIATVGSVRSQESSLLWRVSGNGITQDSYIFGTTHVICKEDFLMDERILKAFERSDQLVLELDMGDPELQTKIHELSMNPGMKNIQSELRPEDAAILDSFLIQNYGAGLDQLGTLRPMVLSSMVLMRTVSCEEIESYEGFFSTKAIESEKSVTGLETPEYQFDIFDQIPVETQLSELVKLVKEDTGFNDFETLTEAYLREDIEELYKMMSFEGMMKDYLELILDNRNKSWIPVLEREMKSKKLFVAVGAGHLGGENGLISLLRKQGYKVDPVKK